MLHLSHPLSLVFFHPLLLRNFIFEQEDQHVSKVTCKRKESHLKKHPLSLLFPLQGQSTIGGPFDFLVYSSQIIFKFKTKDQIDVCGFSCLFFFCKMRSPIETCCIFFLGDDHDVGLHSFSPLHIHDRFFINHLLFLSPFCVALSNGK